MTPHARAEDDQLNLDDLREVEEALIKAHQALTRAMCGIGGRGARDQFVYQVGFARGKLECVSERIYRGGEHAA